MDWYHLSNIKCAAKPPAYLIERISDLKHACELSKTSPREANTVISAVISQLSEQHDEDFVAPLTEAARIMLDSPFRAKDAIEKVVSAMIAEKEIQDAEREDNKWKTQIL